MTSPFSYTDYRKFIKARIDADKDNWGLISRLADAAQFQRSQLSRVLGGHLQLTMDQAFGIADYWHLSHEETNYFLKLVEFERSGNKKYRERIGRELNEMRKENEDLSQRVNRPTADANAMHFYSSWIWQALHAIVTIPELQTASAIAKRLNFPTEFVLSCLRGLKEMGYVSESGGKWQRTAAFSHLPKNSPIVSLAHRNWRERAIHDAQMRQDGLHYTAVQTVSREDFEKIKTMLLKNIDEYNKVARPSKEEELVCFSCDWFMV